MRGDDVDKHGPLVAAAYRMTIGSGRSPGEFSEIVPALGNPRVSLLLWEGWIDLVDEYISDAGPIFGHDRCPKCHAFERTAFGDLDEILQRALPPGVDVPVLRSRDGTSDEREMVEWANRLGFERFMPARNRWIAMHQQAVGVSDRCRRCVYLIQAAKQVEAIVRAACTQTEDGLKRLADAKRRDPSHAREFAAVLRELALRSGVSLADRRFVAKAFSTSGLKPGGSQGARSDLMERFPGWAVDVQDKVFRFGSGREISFRAVMDQLRKMR